MSLLNRIGITTNEINPMFEEAIQIGIGWGVKNFELRDLWGRSTRIPRITAEQERIIYDTFESYGLTCTALSPGIFRDFYSPQTYQEDIRLLEKCFNMAERLRTNIIIVFSFKRGEAGPETIIPGEQVNALREAAYRAADRGMLLALENMRGQWADTAQNSRRVVELVDHPTFRLNWDPANAADAGDISPFPKGYETIREFMVHFHLKNILQNAGKKEWSVLSRGEIDYTAHIRKVVEDGYQGWFIIETHCPPFDVRPFKKHEENTKANLDYLRSTLKEIEKVWEKQHV